MTVGQESCLTDFYFSTSPFLVEFASSINGAEASQIRAWQNAVKRSRTQDFDQAEAPSL